MKASELRIGNWIYLPSKSKKYQISSGHDIEEIEGSDDARPIPLTPEWLERFGFVGGHDGCYDLNQQLIDMGGIGSVDSDLTLIKSPDVPNFYTVWLGVRDVNLRYVHQLQNLYFALTGEELTIKEPVEK